MTINLFKTLTFITVLCFGTFAHAENKNSFLFKTGTFEMNNPSQVLDSSPYEFEAESSSVFSFEYERLLKNDISIGAGFIKYENKIISGASSSNSVDVVHVAATVRKYMPIGNYIWPYFGFGIGTSSASIDNFGVGPGYHGVFGLKLRLKTMSLVIESRYITAKPKDLFSSALDISGDGVFAGVSLDF